MPTEAEAAAPRVCLGNVFRKKEATTVKVGAGETAGGTDIEIPLSGLHTVSGAVTALADGHPITHGSMWLLYADDRERARETNLQEDGAFSFEYVPEGKYILQASGAHDEEQKNVISGQGQTEARTETTRTYADKEIPITVLNEADDMNLSLSAPEPAEAAPANPPGTVTPTAPVNSDQH
jgi:hypothetical protein